MGHENELVPSHISRTRRRGPGPDLRQQWEKVGHCEQRHHSQSLGCEHQFQTAGLDERSSRRGFKRWFNRPVTYNANLLEKLDHLMNILISFYL